MSLTLDPAKLEQARRDTEWVRARLAGEISLAAAPSNLPGCFGKYYDDDCICEYAAECKAATGKKRAVAHGAFCAPGRGGAQKPIAMTGYAGGLIVCTAEHGAFTREAFANALIVRFPSTPAQAPNHVLNPGGWCAGVQTGDPREAITVEEAQRWATLFDGDGADSVPAAGPPPVKCEVCTCSKPATHAMKFDSGLEGYEYYCDEHAAGFHSDPESLVVEDVALVQEAE
jgi:hypothetical protein